MGNRTYTITGANGKDYKIDGPEGASKEQLVDILLHYKPEAGKPPERTVGDYASGAGRAALRGVAGQGEFLLDSTLGDWSPGYALPRAADWAADKMGFAKPVTPRERIASAGVEAATGALGGGGLKTMIRNAVSGAVSGMAGQATQEAGGGVMAQIAANLIGGAAPSGRDIYKAGKSGIRSVVGDPTERAAAELQRNTLDRERAIRSLETRRAGTPFTAPTTAEVAGDPNLAAFERSRMSSQIEGQKQNNAVVRQEAAASGMGQGDTQEVQNIATRRVRSGETRLQMRERLAAEQRAQLEAQGQHRLGTVTQEGEIALQGRQSQAEADLARVQAEQEAAMQAREAAGQQELQTRQQGVGPEVSREESATQIRPEIKAQLEAAKATEQGKWAASEIKNPTPIDMAPRSINRLFRGISAKVDQFYANAGGSVPPGAANIVHDLLKELDADNLNTATIANVDKRLADYAGQRRVSGGHKNSEAAFAEALRDEIADTTGKYMPANVRKAYAEARAATRSRSERFGSGTARLGPIIEPKRYGFNKVSDSELARRLVTSGDPGATLAKELKAAVGDESATRLVSEEMRRLVRDGKIKSAADMLRYQPLLDQFDGLRERVAGVVGQHAANKLGLIEQKAIGAGAIARQKSAGAASIREQEAANRASVAATKAESAGLLSSHDKTSAGLIAEQEEMNAAFKASPLGKAYGERTDPTQAIHELLNDKSGGRSIEILMEQLGDNPDGVDGARRALGEYIRKNSAGSEVNALNRNLPDNANMRKAIKTVLDNGDAALTKEQRAVLEQIHDETGGVQYAKDRGVLAKTYSNQNLPGVSGVASRTIKWALTKFGNEKGMDRLLEKALMNPTFAAELLKRSTNERKRLISRAMRTAAIGTRAGASTDKNVEY